MSLCCTVLPFSKESSKNKNKQLLLRVPLHLRLRYCFFFPSTFTFSWIKDPQIQGMLDRTYFAKIKNWKYCSKIIFKNMNSIMRPIFNEKFDEKCNLWDPWTVHEYTIHYWLSQKVQLKPKKIKKKKGKCAWPKRRNAKRGIQTAP